jgi:hypothetical protein
MPKNTALEQVLNSVLGPELITQGSVVQTPSLPCRIKPDVCGIEPTLQLARRDVSEDTLNNSNVK